MRTSLQRSAASIEEDCDDSWKLCGNAASRAAICMLLSLSDAARAADYYWSVPSGDWSVPANWGVTVPTSSDNAWIVNGSAAAITQSGEACNALYLGDAQSGTVQMSGGDLTVLTSGFIGYLGVGSFTQSGGSSSISNLYLGNDPAAAGTYTLGPGQLTSYYELIGFSGTGNFTQSDGSNTCTCNSFVGLNPGSTGIYTLSGGTFAVAQQEAVGFYGTGTFNQSGGTNSVGFEESGSATAGSNGTYNLGGSGYLSSGSNEHIGTSGTATFNQTGGTNALGPQCASDCRQPGFQRQLHPRAGTTRLL